MCLLIHHPANAVLTEEMIVDFYSRNSDGFGALIKQNAKAGVTMVKTLEKPARIYEIYKKSIAGREALMHFRMKTHGNIDINNVHPYEVNDKIYLMHNGILSIGNENNRDMSDTWHYIREYIKPLVDIDPNIIHTKVFQDLVSAHIGSSNKFAFMDKQGRVVILNKSSGVEHQNMWFSNTYAWSTAKFGYKDKYASTYTYTSTASQKYYKGRPVLTTTSNYNRGSVTSLGPSEDDDAFQFRTWVDASEAVVKGIARKAAIFYTPTYDQAQALVAWIRRNRWETKALIYSMYELPPYQIDRMVENEPEEAAEYILDLFDASNEESEKNALEADEAELAVREIQTRDLFGGLE